jgi:hypothetical protein
MEFVLERPYRGRASSSTLQQAKDRDQLLKLIEEGVEDRDHDVRSSVLTLVSTLRDRAERARRIVMGALIHTPDEAVWFV